MAITETYCNPDLTTGNDDGTTEANAWQSLANAAAGYGAGDRVNVKKTASRDAAGTVTFSTSATALAPVHLRGYTTTIGDGGIYQTSGPIVVTGESVIIEGFDVLAAQPVGEVISVSGDLGRVYRCLAENTSATARGAISISDTDCVNCWAKATNASSSWGIRVDRGTVKGCRVIVPNTTIGIEVECGFRTNVISFNEIRGGGASAGGYGIHLDDLNTGNAIVDGNSIYNFENAIYLSEIADIADVLTTLISNNILYTATSGIKNAQTGVVEVTVMIAGNAIGNVTTDYDGFGDLPILDPITLTADPWTDVVNDDWSLNNTAGAGAAVRGLGIPTDYDLDGTQDNFISVGANQLDASGLFIHPGMAGGMRG